ncbi:retron St85 family effector protein [Kaistia granuli]|uniref:retron St85 family effector protein n=1 Tax=Kaistia granuli TaxID=363259 RepID=UPI0012EBCF90|nr:retron St85 family effector protein [Kaistia granuli]
MNSLHVHAPADFLFVCGGPFDATVNVAKSLRDAFLRMHARGVLGEQEAFVAEGVQIFAPHGPYTDILEFEADLAAMSDVVVLFSEASGSFAELGSFAVIDEVAERLIVVVEDKHYRADSFIKHGPILYLNNKYGPESTYVLNLKDINVASASNLSSLDYQAFEALMAKLMSERRNTSGGRSRFDKRRSSHIIKFIVGLIQHYRVLSFDEIDVILYALGLNEFRSRIDRLIYCAEHAGWIYVEKRGFARYCSPIKEKRALYYKLKPQAKAIIRERWLAQIADYWRKSDVMRFNII